MESRYDGEKGWVFDTLLDDNAEVAPKMIPGRKVLGWWPVAALMPTPEARQAHPAILEDKTYCCCVYQCMNATPGPWWGISNAQMIEGHAGPGGTLHATPTLEPGVDFSACNVAAPRRAR